MKQKFSRILCLALALVMALILCACGKDKASDDPNHFDFGKYALDYKGACIMYNEYGEDALVLTFRFTNNSKEDASYGWSIYEKVIQNGAELESTYVVTDWETYESVSESYFTDVAPGESIEIRLPYKINGTDAVEATLSDLWDNYTYTITVNPAELEREDNSNPDGDDSSLYNFDSVDATPTEEETESAVAAYTDWWDGDWYHVCSSFGRGGRLSHRTRSRSAYTMVKRRLVVCLLNCAYRSPWDLLKLAESNRVLLTVVYRILNTSTVISLTFRAVISALISSSMVAASAFSSSIMAFSSFSSLTFAVISFVLIVFTPFIFRWGMV